jgi:hypothetical protein
VVKAKDLLSRFSFLDECINCVNKFQARTDSGKYLFGTGARDAKSQLSHASEYSQLFSSIKFMFD